MQRSRTRDKNPGPQSLSVSLDGLGFYFTKYGHQDNAKNYKEKTGKLRNSQTVDFVGVIVPQQFKKEAGRTIEDEHKRKSGALFRE